MIEITEMFDELQALSFRRHSTPMAVYKQRAAINKKLEQLADIGLDAPTPSKDRDYCVEDKVEQWFKEMGR